MRRLNPPEDLEDPTLISLVAWTPHAFTPDEYAAMCRTLQRTHGVIVKDITEESGLAFVVHDKNKVEEVDWS